MRLGSEHYVLLAQTYLFLPKHPFNGTRKQKNVRRERLQTGRVTGEKA